MIDLHSLLHLLLLLLLSPSVSPLSPLDYPNTVAFPPRLDEASYVALSDLDGDGYLDVITTYKTNLNYMISTSPGEESTANFVSNDVFSAFVAETISTPTSVAAANILGDSLPDLITSFLSSIVILENNHDLNPPCSAAQNGASPLGCFSTPLVVDSSCQGARSVVAVDVNNDSCIDVAAVCKTTGTAVWYQHDCSTHSFTKKVIYQGNNGFGRDEFDDPEQIVFGDVDGDGILDPVVVTSDTHSYGFSPFLTVISLSGDVTFARTGYDLGDGISNSGNGMYLTRVTLGDFDNDGDLDAAVISYSTSNIYFIENRLNEASNDFGALEPLNPLAGGSTANPGDIQSFDSDGDGDLDLIVTAYDRNTAKIYENVLSSGSHPFNSINNPLTVMLDETPRGPYMLAIGDVNMDGFYDFVTTGYLEDEVFINFNQHTAGCPFGKFMDVDLSSCESCPIGSFKNVTGLYCKQCFPGSSASSTGSKNCSPCSPGSSAPSAGQSTCEPCQAGRFTASSGAISCAGLCPRGKFGDTLGQTGNTNCRNCPAGKSSLAGSTTCTSCDAGQYAPVEGTPECLDCAEGEFSSGGDIDCVGWEALQSFPPLGSTEGNEVLYVVVSGGVGGEHISVEVNSQPCPVLSANTNATHIACLTPSGIGVDLPVTLTHTTAGGSFTLSKAFGYFPPAIQFIGGCTDVLSTNVHGVEERKTVDCPATGGTIVNISGTNFGGSSNNIAVRVNNEMCSNLELLVPHRLISCKLPPGVGDNPEITIDIGSNSKNFDNVLSYVAPSILNVESSDCLSKAVGVEECSREGGARLTMTGTNFGPVLPWFMIGGAICSTPTDYVYDGTNQTTSVCILPPGSGRSKNVNAVQAGGLVSEGVGLVTYDLCDPGTENVLNETLQYFTCEVCALGYTSSLYEAFSCSLCLSGSYVVSPSSCLPCNDVIAGSTSLVDGSVGIKSCVCPSFSFFDEEKSACLACELRGVACSVPGQTVETLEVESGYWRTGPRSLDVRPCHNAEHCIGRNATKLAKGTVVNGSSTSFAFSDQYCSVGTTGPFCQVCMSGYSGVMGNCRKCTSSRTWSKVATLLVLVVFFIVFGYNVSKLTKTKKKLLLISGKIIISTFQILYAVPDVFEVTLPRNFLDFLNYINFINFDLMAFFDVGCTFKRFNIHHAMVTLTVLPFVISLPILVMFLYHLLVEERSGDMSRKEARSSLKMNTVSLLLSLTYLVLPTTSASIFAVFPCDHLDDGSMWLKSDYSVDCSPGNTDHNNYLVYASIMVALYPVGITTVYTIMLVSTRKKLNFKLDRDEQHFPFTDSNSQAPSSRPNSDRVSHRMTGATRGGSKLTEEEEIIYIRENDESIQHTVFLWGSYRPSAWWYEIFECYRRLALTGALVFVQQGSQTQIAVGNLICICSGFVFALSWPYATYRDNIMGLLSQFQIIGTLFSAMMLRLGDNASLAYDEDGVGIVLIVLNGGVFLFLIGEC